MQAGLTRLGSTVQTSENRLQFTEPSEKSTMKPVHAVAGTAILSALVLTSVHGEATSRGAETTRNADAPKTVDFTRDVKPLFVKHCYKCHGPEKQESGFRLDRKADALAGGERGASIIPGDSKKSLLIRYVAGLDEDVTMPPEDELTKKQIATLRAWIDQGAKWGKPKK